LFIYFSRKEAEELKLEVAKWRVAEGAAREKLLSITQLNQTIAVTNAATHAQHNLVQSSPRTLSPPPVKLILFFYLIYFLFFFLYSIDQILEIKNPIKLMNG
jgi:hypothetical protein